MDYEQLKEEVKQIAEIAASVPEQFRDKCFELLLVKLLGASKPTPLPTKVVEPVPDDPVVPPPAESASRNSSINMTAQLRVLLSRAKTSTEELAKVIFVEEGEVHFLREPKTGRVATGQMEWSLLCALKNAVLGKSPTVDPEDVRSICQAKGFYDGNNFFNTFKKPANAKLFKGAMVSQGEPQGLSADGEEALGALLRRLASESQ